jgi:hypothetical protein
MKLLYKTIISQTSIGTVISTLSLGFNITNILIILGLIVVLEFLETLIGLGLNRIWKRLRVKKND